MPPATPVLTTQWGANCRSSSAVPTAAFTFPMPQRASTASLLPNLPCTYCQAPRRTSFAPSRQATSRVVLALHSADNSYSHLLQSRYAGLPPVVFQCLFACPPPRFVRSFSAPYGRTTTEPVPNGVRAGYGPGLSEVCKGFGQAPGTKVLHFTVNRTNLFPIACGLRYLCPEL